MKLAVFLLLCKKFMNFERKAEELPMPEVMNVHLIHNMVRRQTEFPFEIRQF